MKTHGKIDPDGKRRVGVFIDPDGGCLLRSRVTGKGLERLETLPEFRREHLEVTESGELLEAAPGASEEHRALQQARLTRENRSSSSKKR